MLSTRKLTEGKNKENDIYLFTADKSDPLVDIRAAEGGGPCNTVIYSRCSASASSMARAS